MQHSVVFYRLLSELSKCRQHKKLLNIDIGFDVFFPNLQMFLFSLWLFVFGEKKNVITGPQTVPKMVRNS